ncbi:MAG: hypothetical protein KGD64_13175 [Candidatus Heimdallarchaeota archaeon]|nr:hypothetical protein [Candidatus Heimdallarchaeota archaeon]
MSNTVYNSFILLIGFCLLGLPIILISLSTAPPPLTQFQSTMNFESIPGDALSADIIENMKNVNGSSPDLWEDIFADIFAAPQLANINNISELILTENEFMSNYSMDVYTGFSKEIHLFILDMVITAIPTVDEAKNTYMELFSGSNGTMLAYMYMLDDWNSHYISQPNYPSINETIETIYTNFEPLTLEYMVTVSFLADLDINGTQTYTSFERLLFVDDSGIILFFLTNEVAWETK